MDRETIVAEARTFFLSMRDQKRSKEARGWALDRLAAAGAARITHMDPAFWPELAEAMRLKAAE